jgi:dihydrofolate reductase
MSNPQPLISIIVAMASNRAIGKNNQLLWHISNDLKRFKRLTSGNTIVMGRKTFESLPGGALPNRRNIVLSDRLETAPTACELAHSIEEVMQMVQHESEVFIIGGGSVYEQFLPLADKIYLTRVEQNFEGDTFFPPVNFSSYELIEKEVVDNDLQSTYVYTFETYQKKA